MAWPRRRATLWVCWLVATLGWTASGCDDRALPSFADPPPVDAGLDGSADEDGGAEPSE
jgi:hypothetical protein